MMSGYQVFRTRENTTRFPLHSHPRWEILYYTRGTGAIRLGGGDAIPFREGTILCIPPELAHGSASEQAFENYCVQDPFFSPEPFREGGTLFRSNCIVLQDSEDREAEPLFRLMYRAYHGGRADAELSIRHLLTCAYDLMTERLPQTGAVRAVETVRTALADNLSDPSFRPSDAIEALPYSPNHVRNLFRQQTGVTPSRYLLTLRLNCARQLLAQGLTVTEAALRSGFRDPLYFSKQYHNAFGVPPTAERHPAEKRNEP